MVQRLTLEHIQTRSANRPLLQGFDQCRFVHHFAPGDIDENRLRPHKRELLGANQPLSLGSQRQCQAHKIGLLQQVGQAAVLRAKPLFHRRLGRMAVVDHRHAKAKVAPLRQRFTNAPHANDAQGLAMHIAAKMQRADVLVPVAGTHHIRQLHHASGGGEDQRKTGVGGGFGEYIRGVAQQDAALGQVVDVVVINAHRNTGHRFQLRCQVQQGRIQAQACPQQAMGAGQGITQPGQACGVEGFDQRHLGRLMQASHQRRGEFLVQHDMFFHQVLTFKSRECNGAAGEGSRAPVLRKIVSTTDSSNAPLISRYDAPGEPVLLLR